MDKDYRRIASDVVCADSVQIGPFVNLYGCKIGEGTKIGSFVEIQRGATIGSFCKISSHSFVCDGVTVEDNVFVGHHVVFINDKNPQATNDQGVLEKDTDWAHRRVETRVCKGASIGSNATILGGVVIGEGAVVGAGSVVTKDVAPHTTVVGSPARKIKGPRN